MQTYDQVCVERDLLKLSVDALMQEVAKHKRLSKQRLDKLKAARQQLEQNRKNPYKQNMVARGY